MQIIDSYLLDLTDRVVWIIKCYLLKIKLDLNIG